MALTLDWGVIETAFVVATALLGFLIGWKYMAIWTVGVFFATQIASRLGPKLMELINALLGAAVQFFAIMVGKPEGSIPSPTIVISDANVPMATGLFFLFLISIAAWVSRALGNNINVGLLGKTMGAIFGGLGTILILSEVSNYYQQYVALGGRDPLAGTLHLAIPALTIGGQSGAPNWAGLGTIAIALFVLSLVVYTIWRVVRTVL